jgi:hypothetical protein
VSTKAPHKEEEERDADEVYLAAPEDHHESAGQGWLRRSTEIEGEQEERRTRAMEEGEARNGGGNPSWHPHSLGRRHLPRSPKTYTPSIKSSCIEREVEIEKTEVCGMEGGRGMRPSRQKVRGGKPNTTLERGHPGKPWEDGPFRVTNQSLSKLIAKVKRGERRSGL